MVGALLSRGWARWPADPALRRWVAAARPVAEARARDPGEREKWLECDGTWFVGVDALPNGPDGAVAGSGPLSGAAVDAACALYGRLELHRAQVSVVYPGYPRPRKGEGQGAFRYRLNRDAAHVDGLLAVGPDRRRMLKERHAYILGLPLSDSDPAASPLVVWEGSHAIMRAAFAAALGDLPEAEWDSVDLTDCYHAARREAFETCPRLELHASPGEAYLLHRLVLHGVAPWGADAQAEAVGRMIAYFRPEFPGGTRAWLDLP